MNNIVHYLHSNLSEFSENLAAQVRNKVRVTIRISKWFKNFSRSMKPKHDDRLLQEFDERCPL